MSVVAMTDDDYGDWLVCWLAGVWGGSQFPTMFLTVSTFFGKLDICFRYGCAENRNLCRFGFKNRTVQKFDIHSDGFPIETACNPLFK